MANSKSRGYDCSALVTALPSECGWKRLPNSSAGVSALLTAPSEPRVQCKAAAGAVSVRGLGCRYTGVLGGGPESIRSLADVWFQHTWINFVVRGLSSGLNSQRGVFFCP